MQSLRTRPHLLALALASVLAAPVALAQQVIADGTAQTPAAGDYSATGVGNHAFHALNGGSIVPLGPVNVSASGDGASAARAEGAGSRIELNGATLVTTGFGATTALATTGGELQLTAIDVLNQGTGMGVVAQTGSQATLQDVNIRMEGVSSVGLSGGGNITMTGGSISAMGLGSRAVSAIGATMALSNVAIEGASGIWLENNNRLDLAGSTVKANGIALDINGFGNTVTVSDSTLHSTANGTGTVTMFADSTLAMAGGAIVSEGDRAVGIDMRGGSADLERVEVTTSGESSHGLYADYTTFGTRPGINARAVQIHTSGSSAIGAVARQGGSIQLQDSVIRTEGQEAYGVLAGGSGAMTLTNTDVRTEGEGAWAAVINNSGSLRIDGGSLESVQHGGVWVRSSRDAGLTLANGAQLTGGNGTALALDAAVAGRFDVRLEDGAQMDGDVVIHPDDVAAGLVPQSEVHVALDAASLWSGGTTLAQTVALAGGSQWTLQGASEVGALSLDDSALVLGTDARGGVGTLTVTGNLTTTGARLMFRGALADDASELGHLHVLGDTGGDASISVENLGGSGAQTVDGIELIKVDGASLGTYTLSGRAVAGLYEYLLHKGGVAGGDGNWYLRSAAIDPCEVDPTGPGCT
ncbi:right-handed parallel beta-helix repeat-containing protein, partial [Stenotrophomonas maltophilia]